MSSNIIDSVGSYADGLLCHVQVILEAPTVAVQAQIQINALAYKNLFDSNGNPVLANSLADRSIIEFYYSAAIGAFVLSSLPAITDAVLREQALEGDYLVEAAWGGNFTQSLDINGNRLASIAGATEPYPTFPASRVIAGTRFPKDYLTDKDNNYWKSTNAAPFGTPAWVAIDFGQVREFNAVVIYQHPTLPLQSNGDYIPSCNSFNLYGTNTLPGGFPFAPHTPEWDLIGSITLIGGETGQVEPGEDALNGKTEIRFRSSVSYRYLALRTSGTGGADDTDIRVCSIEAYHWVDESARVVWNDGQGPAVEIERVLDQSQTSIPTPSECRLTFVNEDGRYTPGNSLSPLYGNQQVDGRGEGVRSGIPVRVEAHVRGSDGVLRGKRQFDGFVANDQSVGGPMAVSTDEDSRQALFVCKGISTTLTNEIDTPVYEGDYFSTMLKDLVARGAIAFQDLLVRSIFQAVPFVSFTRQGVLASLTAIGKAMPFFRVFERHDPAAIEVKNRGRTRADLDFARFPGGTNNLRNAGFVVQPSGAQTAVDMSLSTKSPVVVSGMLHDGDSHYFFNSSVLTQTVITGLRPILGSPKIYRWDEKQSISDSVLSNQDYDATNLQRGTSIWHAIYNGNMYELTGGWAALDVFPRFAVRSAGLLPTGVISFSNLGTIQPAGPAVGEKPIAVIMRGKFIYFLTYPAGTGGVKSAPNNPNLQVWDVTQAFATKLFKGADTGGAVDVRHIMADDSFFAYTKATKSTQLRIWNHGGTPYATALSYVTKNYFSFGDVNGTDNYASSTVPRVRYFLADDGYLYCAAQPQKANTLYRYEVWRVKMADLYAGTATATLLGVLADNVTNDISDLVVKNGYVYVLDRFSLWVWDTTKDISRKFDLGTAFQHVPSKNPDTGIGIFDPVNNKFNIPGPFINKILSRTRPQFLHQGTFEESGNYISTTAGGASYGWVDRHVDVGPDTPGIDSKGRIWVMLGEDSDGRAFSSQLRCFSISDDQFNLTPTISFGIFDGFVETMKIMDGNPEANSIKMSVNPFRLDPNVSALWTQQDSDPITFPAGVQTTIEIQLNSISGRGYGTSTTTRRYINMFGKNIFDDPNASTNVTIETVSRSITFWALGQKAFLTIDNTSKPACQVAGAIVYGKAIAPRFSNSTVVESKADDSIRLYKRKIELEVSNEFANDPTFENDMLLAWKYASLWAEPVKVPWYPNLEPGDEILLTYPEDGIVNKPFEITGVKHNGFKTEFMAKEVRPIFVI